MMTNMTGKTIYHYQYDYADGSGVWSAENKFKITEHEALVENEDYLVIDDSMLTSLAKENNTDFNGVNKDRVVFKLDDDFWGNKVMYNLYSTEKLSTNTVKDRIAKHIKEKIAWLGDVDLSVISEVSA